MKLKKKTERRFQIDLRVAHNNKTVFVNLKGIVFIARSLHDSVALISSEVEVNIRNILRVNIALDMEGVGFSDVGRFMHFQIRF